MAANFFRYLRGETGYGDTPDQMATGYFECFKCFAPAKEAKIIDGKAVWECVNGHSNREAYVDVSKFDG